MSTIKRRGVSPILAAAVLVALTVVIGAALAATIVKPPSGEKTPQLQVSGWASKSQNVIKLTHMGGDPVYTGNIEIKTYIPSGQYTGATYTVPSTAYNSAMTWKAGDVLEITFNEAFGAGQTPNPGEQFIVEIYYRGQPVASCTITLQP